jgi:D-lactate dehydrogenase
LQSIVGRAHVLTDPRRTRRFSRGFRSGGGPAAAVVRPGSLLELWRVLRECVAAGRIIIMQAANTGLTGGSTPDSGGYDREVVIINTLRLSRLYLLRGGREVLCLAGCTLHQLERALEPMGREPHSVIGSSCIGASVVGGISNNSGGALIRRGPAYTQMALFARLDANGELRLTNHLDIDLGEDPERLLERLDRGAFGEEDLAASSGRVGSDHDYQRRVRDVDADSPARFNADERCLYEASGSAGKLAIFAVRLETFPKDATTRTFYIGTNDPAVLTGIRRRVLKDFGSLPIAAEYMHRGAFDLAQRYGKSLFLLIHYLGTSQLPRFLALNAWFESIAGSRMASAAGRLLQRLSALLPRHLPVRMLRFRERYEHHLMLKVASGEIDETRACLKSMFASAEGDFFECDGGEARKAFLHRFVAAGAAIQYRDLHGDQVEDIVALDIALRRNDRDWFETLPPDLAAAIEAPVYYGHFFCHVFHQDYIVRKGQDCAAIKARLCALLEARRAEYPAEHNVGHSYAAKPPLVRFYRELDPCNCFNPGIGKTPRYACWQVPEVSDS